MVIQVFHGNESKWKEVKKEEVPNTVFEFFILKNPNIVVEKWYKLNKRQYIASFEKNKKRVFSIISANGNSQNELLIDQDDMYGYDDFDDYIDSDYYE
jgi:hypothetical protein